LVSTSGGAPVRNSLVALPVKEVSLALLQRIVVFFHSPPPFSLTLVGGETTDDWSDENRSISMQR
jgi:hypothetical protein